MRRTPKPSMPAPLHRLVGHVLEINTMNSSAYLLVKGKTLRFQDLSRKPDPSYSMVGVTQLHIDRVISVIKTHGESDFITIQRVTGMLNKAVKATIAVMLEKGIIAKRPISKINRVSNMVYLYSLLLPNAKISGTMAVPRGAEQDRGGQSEQDRAARKELSVEENP
jgi:hypothetical protein